ncbi:unnamed protein product [Clavelina lepadiformis]|uniref:DNA polymerase subunit gamma-1 n=1 Tax=Clavelina lepadiformis TaxID=159417 RepID=A0ABP0F8A8_CLALP
MTGICFRQSHCCRYISKQAWNKCAVRLYSASCRKKQNTFVDNTNNKNEPRYNPVGIQMLPEGLHRQIFKQSYVDGHLSLCQNDMLEECIKHLSKFELWGQEPEKLPDLNFKLPEIKGKNINEHFENIAKEQASSYALALHSFLSSNLPKMPKKDTWVKKRGWTKYVSKENGEFEIFSVDFPDSSVLVFDCEVLSSISDVPIIATAVSEDAWFSWTSQHLFDDKNDLGNNLDSLVPMEPRELAISDPKNTPKKLIVGHNVSYDRARIKEQYYPQATNVRFLDTMSMHIAISGFNSQQRSMSLSGKSATDQDENKKTTLSQSWVQAGSLNNLSDVHKFYCGNSLEKSIRDTFVKGNLSDVQIQFNELMAYCASDVYATYNVLRVLTPLFFEHFPHVVTFAGMLEMGSMYLPVNGNWNRYIRSCEDEYEGLTLELKRHLQGLMNDACHLIQNKNYENDKWLWDVNWNTQNIKLLKSPRKNFQLEPEKHIRKLKTFLSNSTTYALDELSQLGKSCEPNYCYKHNNPNSIVNKLRITANRLPKVRTHMPGCPKWYSELCFKENDAEWSLDASKLSTLTRMTPKLLRMTWLGYPLHYQEKLGWGYLVPQTEEKALLSKLIDSDEAENTLQEINQNGNGFSETGVIHTPAENVQGLPNNDFFHKLPHKNGIENNVGSPLSHDFIGHIETGFLSSADSASAMRCLEINKMCSYWRSSQNRILSQMRINLTESVLPSSITQDASYNKELDCGAIVPQAAVCGTVSRRAVERTWLTASNIQPDRIGSELKCMVQAPPGFKFVGADVDSEELWIASLFGDASFIGEHGCTALSWMTLRGNKRDGTDLHSKTAKTIGTSRNAAKVFNYARMYGAGKQSLLRAYMQNNKNVPKDVAAKKINDLYKMTKGQLKYKLSYDALWFVKKTNVSICPTAKRTGWASYEDVARIKAAASEKFGQFKSVNNNDLICGRKWDDGIESHMFNKLEQVATSKSPETPVLKCKITRSLLPSKVQSNFLPGRMNWVVQSSAVDYLHLLLVAMRWLINEYKLNARFLISIHDEFC